MTEMYFKQILHEDCGCSSYIVGGKATNEVAVVDPSLDLDEVLEVAAIRGFTVRYVIDTHIHADHVSGARKLAEATGAELCMHRSADVRFRFRPLDDGQVLTLGNVTLEVMHTPGHRPESLTLLVTNHAQAESVSMAITGDTLLVGDVGRPDFGGEEGAAELWESMQRLLALDDYVEVFPSHFDGPCGRGMCGRPSTTIGFERRFNPALQLPGKDAFVREIGGSHPARPLNMDAIIATNIGVADKPWVMPRGEEPVPEIAAADAERWLRDHPGAAVIDVREAHEYARGHIPAARLVTQADLADRLDDLPRDGDVLVVCEAGSRSVKAARFLRRQGYAGAVSLAGGTEAWAARGNRMEM